MADRDVIDTDFKDEPHNSAKDDEDRLREFKHDLHNKLQVFEERLDKRDYDLQMEMQVWNERIERITRELPSNKNQRVWEYRQERSYYRFLGETEVYEDSEDYLLEWTLGLLRSSSSASFLNKDHSLQTEVKLKFLNYRVTSMIIDLVNLTKRVRELWILMLQGNEPFRLLDVISLHQSLVKRDPLLKLMMLMDFLEEAISGIFNERFSLLMKRLEDEVFRERLLASYSTELLLSDKRQVQESKENKEDTSFLRPLLCLLNNRCFSEFVPIESFTMETLPFCYNHKVIFDTIKCIATLTTRIEVTYTSPDRPEFLPNTMDPFPSYNARGKNLLRTGNGKVCYVKQFNEEMDGYETCPCPECVRSEKPCKVWWRVDIQTTRQMVFDDSESRQSICKLGLDDNKSLEVSLYGFKLNVPSEDADCIIHCATHDLQFGKKLRKMTKLFGCLENVISRNEKFQNMKPFSIVVSYVNKGSKQISTGQLVYKKSLACSHCSVASVYTLFAKADSFQNSAAKYYLLSRPVNIQHSLSSDEDESRWTSYTETSANSIFISAYEFTIENLPLGHQTNDLYEFTKALAALTARITVNYTSESRPDFVPDSEKPYPGHSTKETNIVRVGTGRVINIIKHTDGNTGNGTCPCPECDHRGSPCKVWWCVEVQAAKHVAFDDHEVKHSICRLWFDDDNSPVAYLYGWKINWSDTDLCGMFCATHDLNLGNKLQKMKLHFNSLCRNIWDKYQQEERLSIVIHHPRGRSKQISVCHWIHKQELIKNSCCVGITCTCAGSCGAYVYILGSENINPSTQIKNKEVSNQIVGNAIIVGNNPISDDDTKSDSVESRTSDREGNGETLVNLCDHSMSEPEPPEIENLIKALRACVQNKTKDTFYAEQVLRFAYYVGKNKTVFTAHIQREIGQLVYECIDAIATCNFHNAHSFDVDHGPYYLILRSGLQFILDDYKPFRTEQNKILVEAFKNQRLQNSIEKFDKALEQWKSSDITSYDCIIHDDSELVRPTSIPTEHTWWFNADELL